MTYYYFISPQPFKNAKTILSSWAKQKQATSWIWRLWASTSATASYREHLTDLHGLT